MLREGGIRVNVIVLSSTFLFGNNFREIKFVEKRRTSVRLPRHGACGQLLTDYELVLITPRNKIEAVELASRSHLKWTVYGSFYWCWR